MEAADVITKSLEMNSWTVRKALEDLSDADLLKRPNADSNPIGWLLWHLTRVEDGVIARITGAPQVWMEGKWHERFGMEADPQNSGLGHTLEQVTALKPGKEALLGYAAAVREKTTACLENITSAELDREIEDVIGGAIRVGELLGRLTVDHFHHGGQICYLRGYITGWGWFPL
ncbi:MAG: DinB family protein [bacterium]